MPVAVNGIAGTFLVDTGSDCTIIDSAFARRLGLKTSGSVLLERNYSTEEVSTVRADTVRIGSNTWTRVPLVPLDLSLIARIQQAPIIGVVGTDILAAMRIRLSYSSGIATVANGDAGGIRVALSKVRKRYFLPIRIGVSQFTMLLDTGTNMTALSDSAWRSMPASWAPHGTVEGIRSSESPLGSLIACIPELNLGQPFQGELVLREYPLRVMPPSPDGTFASAYFAGIVGGDILERFEVVLDLAHTSVYLKAQTGFSSDPYEFVTIGIQILKTDADAFSIVAVWKDSPAEAAGVLVGDRILSLNGHPSSDLSAEEFARQLHGPAGTPVLFEVERPPGRFVLRMKTRQLVCEAGPRRL